jgi:hypothetical protein
MRAFLQFFNGFVVLEIPSFQGNDSHDVLQNIGVATPDARILELEFYQLSATIP